MDDAVDLAAEVGESGEVHEEHAVGVEVWSVREGHQFLLRLVVLAFVSDGRHVLGEGWRKIEQLGYRDAFFRV